MTDALDRRRRNFLDWLDREKLTVAKIAQETKLPPTTLYGYTQGKVQTLKGPVESKIAEVFKSRVELIFGDNFPVAQIGVYGKIGARAEVYPVDDDHRDAPMYEVPVPPGLDLENEYIAFEVDGFSMPPAEPGWLVIFRKIERTPEDLINAPCLVDLTDGRRLFKRLRKGYEPGLYNLESWDGSPLIENVKVVCALPFASLTPGRCVR